MGCQTEPLKKMEANLKGPEGRVRSSYEPY